MHGMKGKKEGDQNGFVKDMSLSDPALANNLSLAGGHEVSTQNRHLPWMC